MSSIVDNYVNSLDNPTSLPEDRKYYAGLYNSAANKVLGTGSVLYHKDTGGIMNGLSNWAEKNKFGIGLIGGIADLGMGLAKYGLTKKYLDSKIASTNEAIAAQRQKIASRNGIQAAFSGVRV